LLREMAAQSDFTKHGAVALSEVAAFDDFVRKGRPSPLSLWESPFVRSGSKNEEIVRLEISSFPMPIQK
jgi:hypothetical protein